MGASPLLLTLFFTWLLTCMYGIPLTALTSQRSHACVPFGAYFVVYFVADFITYLQLFRLPNAAMGMYVGNKDGGVSSVAYFVVYFVVYLHTFSCLDFPMQPCGCMLAI